jgi:hypothetical protein
VLFVSLCLVLSVICVSVSCASVLFVSLCLVPSVICVSVSCAQCFLCLCVLCLSVICVSVLYFFDCAFNFLYHLLTPEILEFVMVDVDKRHNIFLSSYQSDHFTHK